MYLDNTQPLNMSQALPDIYIRMVAEFVSILLHTQFNVFINIEQYKYNTQLYKHNTQIYTIQI